MENNKSKDKKTFKKWMFPWLLSAVLSDITFLRGFCHHNTPADLRILHAVNAVLFTSIAVHLIWKYQKKFGKHQEKD